MPTLFLIDTFSLLFQVFHAIPSMTSPKGLPANAVFGFTRDLFNFLKQHQPTHWVCAMDSPGDGVRRAKHPLLEDRFHLFDHLTFRLAPLSLTELQRTLR